MLAECGENTRPCVWNLLPVVTTIATSIALALCPADIYFLNINRFLCVLPDFICFLFVLFLLSLESLKIRHNLSHLEFKPRFTGGFSQLPNTAVI